MTAGPTNILPAVTIVADPLTNTDDPSMSPALFRIGEWDGTPRAMLNGDKITVMHPQDVRISSWTATSSPSNPFLVGTSKAALHMPAYQWKGLATATACPTAPNAQMRRLPFNSI